jgi:hypothetical protein
MKLETARKWVKALAILGIVHAALLVLASFALFAGPSALTQMQLPQFLQPEEMAALGFVTLLYAVLVLWASVALMRYQNWARIFYLVLAVIGLLNFPYGTIVGILAIWVLAIDSTAVSLFRRGGMAARPTTATTR